MIEWNTNVWKSKDNLKHYIRQYGNGEINLTKLSYEDLFKLAKSTEKANVLINEGSQQCQSCCKIIDECNCDRCNICFEILLQCTCEKIIKIKNQIPQKILETSTNKSPHKNLTISPAKKKKKINN